MPTSDLKKNQFLRRLEATFEQATIGIAHVSADGRFQWLNQAFADVVGYTKEELYEKTFQEITHPDDLEADLQKLGALERGEINSYAMEKRYVNKNGSPVWIRLTGSKVVGDDGEIFYTAMIREIGREKAEETEKLRLAEVVEQANKRKDEFIGILAHELRNPLAPVRIAADILSKTAKDDPRLKGCTEVIGRQVSHMARLIDDLLDMSRIVRGKMELKKERVDLVEIVKQTAEDYRGSLSMQHVALFISVLDRPCYVEGDPVRLAQMVGNLLHNAGRFMGTRSDARVDLIVEIDAETKTGRVVVQDNGIGMEPAFLAGLFDPFQQAKQDLARSKGGLGLGLALTKGLVELHGGSITATSQGPGRGSKFTLRLPLDMVQEETPKLVPTSVPPARSLRVLVIEDNEDSAQMMAEYLSMAGHQVAVAYDGLQGVDAAMKTLPDVVVSDIGLPGAMDGYEVARVLRSSPLMSKTPLIAVSGYADTVSRQKSLEAGFNAHFAKPAQIGVLDKVLRQIAEGEQLIRKDV